jgi:two-component system sensor histidine kinase/response regulator
MRSLIFDLLDLTRIESVRKKRDLRPIDMYDIAKSVCNTVEPLAIQRNIKIHLDCEEHLYITADSNEMEIILNNLVSNAVKYNKENGEVFITITKKNNQLLISVEDTGIGISKEDTKLLFQDFVRIKSSETKFVTGSGLGLPIAKRIVELYQGTIDVESEPGKGSKFNVKIPLQ